MFPAPETAPPPSSVHHAVATAHQPVVARESTPARHSLLPVVHPMYVRRDVSPYVPASRGPIPMIVYQPSAKSKHAKPCFYPGTLVAVTPKKTSVPSAAVGRPPRESTASDRLSRERRRKSRSRKESHRREKSPRHRSRRDRPSHSRSASPRDRRTSTPPRGSRSRLER